MLAKLIIKNIALIDAAEIDFEPGLNVLSGETGAGKSVILDSINFVLGAKADRTMIRYGESECSVYAIFRPEPDNPVWGTLRELDIETDEDVIISRKYRMDGRGDIRVNGNAVSAGMLRKITANLVDVHGQSEHFYLLSEINQLVLLDRAAGEPLEQIKKQLAKILSESRELERKLKVLGGNEAARERRLDVLKYQIDEIQRADLRDGEEEKLLSKRTFFANIEKIMHSLSEAVQYLNEDGAVIDLIHAAGRSLADISRLDHEYESLYDRMENLAADAEDIGETLNDLAENICWDEEEAAQVEDRLDLIRSLKKKYGKSIEEILQYYETISQEYDLLSHSDAEYARLTNCLEEIQIQAYALCGQMTKIRKDIARQFCGAVAEELHTLNIPKAQFEAQFDGYTENDIGHVTCNGLDVMRFMFSANAGEPFKPLNKVISGGEMSRLMLAIKTCMSDVNFISTYIFDEIDAGISGKTAKTVAEKFAAISRDKQVIAVSHLAQIAAMADANFLIAKSENHAEKTVTTITAVDDKERNAEIVRLLGGDDASGAARQLADELLLESKCMKQRIRTNYLN